MTNLTMMMMMIMIVIIIFEVLSSCRLCTETSSVEDRNLYTDLQCDFVRVSRGILGKILYYYHNFLVTGEDG